MLPLPSAHTKVASPSPGTVDPDSQNGASEVKAPIVDGAPKSSNPVSPLKISSNGFAAEPAASAAMALAAPRPTMTTRTTSIAGFRKLL